MGGMGDVLLSLEDALQEREITLYSHNEDAPKLLTSFGIKVRFEHFLDHTEVVTAGRPVRQRQYPVVPIPEASLARARALAVRRRVIGLHPIGSAFSRRLGERRRTPLKRVPPDVVRRLLDTLDDGDTSVLLFCAPGERAEFESERLGPTVTVVAEADPWDTLACVTLCHRVIAVDSVIKTMSALRRIPTLVLLGDHRDRYRDKHFINPYVRDGVMHVVRFTDPALIDAAGVAAIVDDWEARPKARSRWLRWKSRAEALLRR
jgi:ADP-heptose:LPS heptosyltransferase